MASGRAAPGTNGLSRGHRIVRLAFALGVGLALALYAYRLVTDPELAAERARQEAVVASSRDILRTYVGGAGLEIVDPLDPDAKVGKSYLYPADDGWEVSGHYRRGSDDSWHPYLMRLDGTAALVELSVKDDDSALRRRAAEDAKLTVSP